MALGHPEEWINKQMIGWRNTNRVNIMNKMWFVNPKRFWPVFWHKKSRPYFKYALIIFQSWIVLEVLEEQKYS